MFLKIVRQNRGIREYFRNIIAMSSAKYSSSERYQSNLAKGREGEARTFRGLLFSLPHYCYLMNDIVLEVAPNEFIQIDHLVICKKGIYIIETKNWSGSYVVTENTWNKVEGNTYVNMKDPIEQQRRHKELFRQWLVDTFEADGTQAAEYIFTYIVAKKSSINSNSNQSVFESGFSVGRQINSFVAYENISAAMVKDIVAAVKNALPLNHYLWFRKHAVKDIREVFVPGDETFAQWVQNAYQKEGYKTGEIEQQQDGWKFSLMNHFEIFEEKRNARIVNYAIPRTRARKKSYRYNNYSWPYNGRKKRNPLIALLLILFIIWGIPALMKIVPNRAETTQNAEYTKSTSSQKPNTQVQNNSSPIVLSIDVKYGQSYVRLSDSAETLIEKVAPVGTKIVVFKDKRITITEPGNGMRENKISGSSMIFEVGNQNAEVQYQGQQFASWGELKTFEGF